MSQEETEVQIKKPVNSKKTFFRIVYVERILTFVFCLTFPIILTLVFRYDLGASSFLGYLIALCKLDNLLKSNVYTNGNVGVISVWVPVIVWVLSSLWALLFWLLPLIFSNSKGGRGFLCFTIYFYIAIVMGVILFLYYGQKFMPHGDYQGIQETNYVDLFFFAFVNNYSLNNYLLIILYIFLGVFFVIGTLTMVESILIGKKRVDYHKLSTSVDDINSNFNLFLKGKIELGDDAQTIKQKRKESKNVAKEQKLLKKQNKLNQTSQDNHKDDLDIAIDKDTQQNDQTFLVDQTDTALTKDVEATMELHKKFKNENHSRH